MFLPIMLELYGSIACDSSNPPAVRKRYQSAKLEQEGEPYRVIL